MMQSMARLWIGSQKLILDPGLVLVRSKLVQLYIDAYCTENGRARHDLTDNQPKVDRAPRKNPRRNSKVVSLVKAQA